MQGKVICLTFDCYEYDKVKWYVNEKNSNSSDTSRSCQEVFDVSIGFFLSP